MPHRTEVVCAEPTVAAQVFGVRFHKGLRAQGSGLRAQGSGLRANGNGNGQRSTVNGQRMAWSISARNPGRTYSAGAPRPIARQPMRRLPGVNLVALCLLAPVTLVAG